VSIYIELELWYFVLLRAFAVKPSEAAVMKPTRPRISVRTLMLVVGLAGLIVFGLLTAMRVGPRARRFQSLALQWRVRAEANQEHLALCRNKVAGCVRAANRLSSGGYNIYQAEELERRNADTWLWWRENQAHTEEMIAYGAMMESKYERAARYPWLAVVPDPPVPCWSGVTGPATDEQIESIGRVDAEHDTGKVAAPPATDTVRPESASSSQHNP
jgi:hypothetical protein